MSEDSLQVQLDTLHEGGPCRCEVLGVLSPVDVGVRYNINLLFDDFGQGQHPSSESRV